MINFEDNIFNEINDIYSTCKSDEIVSDLEFVHARFSICTAKQLSSLSKEDKREFLRRLIEDEASVDSYKLIDLLIELDKVDYLLGDNFDQFIDFYKKSIEVRGEIFFYSPVELNQTSEKSIHSKIVHFFGGKPRIVYLIDEDLIAGCKIIFKNQSFDLSLKNRYPKMITKYLT